MSKYLNSEQFIFKSAKSSFCTYNLMIQYQGAVPEEMSQIRLRASSYHLSFIVIKVQALENLQVMVFLHKLMLNAFLQLYVNVRSTSLKPLWTLAG